LDDATVDATDDELKAVFDIVFPKPQNRPPGS
jgi:hypothetical protein